MAARTSPPIGWDRHEVIAQLRRKNLTLAHLARENGCSPQLFYIALERPYPRIEKIIADALHVTVEDIWPERVARRRMRSAA